MTSQPPHKPTFRVALQALPNDSRPPATRLRTLLKFALRALRFRCVGLEEIKPELIDQSADASPEKTLRVLPER